VTVLETDRLALRRLTADDAPFILELLNQPSFLRYVGDKGVRTLDDSRRYLAAGPLHSYEVHGFGLFLVEVKATGEAAGICGLLKRETLEDVDLGFAFLPAFWGRGYAIEAAAATLSLGWTHFGLKRLVAITALDNERSIHLLEKLGFRFETILRLAENSPELKLYAAHPAI
jgi:[ribosomal protein S5]-alanine N-acetyltransferase